MSAGRKYNDDIERMNHQGKNETPTSARRPPRQIGGATDRVDPVIALVYLQKEKISHFVRIVRYQNGDIPYTTITIHILTPECSKLIALGSAVFLFDHHGQRH